MFASRALWSSKTLFLTSFRRNVVWWHAGPLQGTLDGNFTQFMGSQAAQSAAEGTHWCPRGASNHYFRHLDFLYIVNCGGVPQKSF